MRKHHSLGHQIEFFAAERRDAQLFGQCLVIEPAGEPLMCHLKAFIPPVHVGFQSVLHHLPEFIELK